jgi:hypothetical protein
MSIKDFFKLPSPKELGLSKHNALQSRLFSPETTGFTWEDYYKYCKSKWPIKYWLIRSLPYFIKYNVWFKIKNPINKLYWYLRYNFVPGSKYHMLDLRQPKPKDGSYSYRYGYLEPAEQLLYGMFAALNNYMKDNADTDTAITSSYSAEEIENDLSLKSQLAAFAEIKLIHKYWNVDREEERKIIDKMQDELYAARKAGKPINYDHKIINKLEEDILSKEEEMMIRLIKVRNYLWG